MSKLTAKLSDGREYEVVGDWSASFEGASENRVMWLNPIKREPREWYEVRSASTTFYAPDLKEAKRLKEEGTTIFLVREVIE
jgi:hypothetical protein